MLQRFCRFAKKLRRAHSWFRSWNNCDGFYFNVRCCWRRLLFCEKIKTKKSENIYFFLSFNFFYLENITVLEIQAVCARGIDKILDFFDLFKMCRQKRAKNIFFIKISKTEKNEGKRKCTKF